MKRRNHKIVSELPSECRYQWIDKRIKDPHVLAVILDQRVEAGVLGGGHTGTKVVIKTHGVEFSITRKIADVEDDSGRGGWLGLLVRFKEYIHSPLLWLHSYGNCLWALIDVVP